MNLLNETFEHIDERLIQRLFDNQIQESKTLDYKREINLKSNDDKRELLADITSFANTEGGVIIFGIEEKKNEKGENTGLPEKASDLKIDNPDKFLQSLEDIVHNNTEPKLSAAQVKIISYKEQQLLIVGVPKYIGLPFMVTLNSTNKFYKRRNTGKYLVDVYELSEIFLKNYKMKERAEQFRLSRLKQVRALEFLPNLDIKGSYFLHIIPLGYLDENLIELSNYERIEQLRKDLVPIDSGGYSHRHNLEGFLTHYSYNAQEIKSYVQLFRDGTMEYYTSTLHHQRTADEAALNFNGYFLEKETIEKVGQSFRVLDYLKIEPPYVIFISVFDLLGGVIDGPKLMFTKRGDRNEIHLPSVVFNSRTEDIAGKMKSTFDIFWQSANYPKSPYYDDQGQGKEPH
jgi:hypothetical protein